MVQNLRWEEMVREEVEEVLKDVRPYIEYYKELRELIEKLSGKR